MSRQALGTVPHSVYAGDLLTKTALASLLGCDNPRQIEWMVKSGKAPPPDFNFGHKLGKRWKFESVSAWLKESH